jgi:hypothetical protein
MLLGKKFWCMIDHRCLPFWYIEASQANRLGCFFLVWGDDQGWSNGGSLLIFKLRVLGYGMGFWPKPHGPSRACCDTIVANLLPALWTLSIRAGRFANRFSHHKRFWVAPSLFT